MSKISKWIRLLLFFILIGGLLAGCEPPQTAGSVFPDGTTAPDNPLRPTLSYLQTAAAPPQETPSAATAYPSVPQTGASETPLPVQQPLTDPTITPTENVLILPTEPAPTCTTADSKMALSASKTAVKVGETIVVKVVLKNPGCASLGMPRYQLAILNSEGKPIFSPDKPEPVTHYLGVEPGSSDEVMFTLQAVSPGKATLSAMASFEAHLGYPGPAYWVAGSSNQLIIQVNN